MTWYVALPLALFIITVFLIFKRLRKSSLLPSKTSNLEILEIRVPKGEEGRFELQTAALAAEHMFASLHGLLKDDPKSQEQISFEFVSVDRGIRFYATTPAHIAKFVESQIYAQYPTAHISKVEDYVPDKFREGEYKVATLSFKKPEYYPIKTFGDFEIDSLSAITSAMSEVDFDESLWFQLVIRPIADVWQEPGYKYVEMVREGTGGPPSLISEIPSGVFKEVGKIVSNVFSGLLGKVEEVDPYASRPEPKKFLNASEEVEVTAIEEKLSKMGFEVNIRLLSLAADKDRAEGLLRSLVASMKQFSTVQLNAFSYASTTNNPASFEDFKDRVINPSSTFVLNIEELASMYHLPSSKVKTPGVSRVEATKAEPPANLPTEDCNYIAETLFRDRKVSFGISNEGEDRVRHMYLIGKTGTGKSTFFKNMIVQDIEAGFGVGVVDPHGELIEDILEYIPENRINDVVIVDPSDQERPVGINVLEMDDPSQKNLMASALVSSMKQHFWSWGPRLEYLLNYSVLTLLEVPGTTMLGITRLLTDMNYQKFILHQIKDPVVLDFWNEEYKAMRGNQRLITEAVAPIQNKINRFLSSTTIRNILGQKNSTVDIWDVLNNKKILLLNLSKGRIGEDNANLLGALLVSRIQFMAMQRIKIPPKERNPFYLYVDEFQNFAGGNFESILSESRKYKLGLHLTHQFTSQLPEDLLSAIFGNVGTIASFSVGAQDAKLLETEFAPYFDENDLISLRKFQIYLKLMVDGQTSKPFSATVPRPWIPEETMIYKTKNKEATVKQSREKYGTDREYVEEKIRRWVEFDFDRGKAIAQGYKKEKRVGDKKDGKISLKKQEEKVNS
jgi:hypothetical protein